MIKLPQNIDYQKSYIDHRSDVSTKTKLTRNLEIHAPFVSANMDTVTEAEMAIALAREGGIGVIHRFMTIEEEVAEKKPVPAVVEAEIKKREAKPTTEVQEVAIPKDLELIAKANPMLFRKARKAKSLDEFLLLYPSFKGIYDKLEFSEGEFSSCGMPFMSAHFMSSQTYIMRDIYNSFMDFNDGKMDKEDCLFTLFLSVLGINLVQWNNMGEFVKSMGKHYGDFDEGEDMPLVPLTVITDKNQGDYEEARFNRVT